jgi:hypothetical protein
MDIGKRNLHGCVLLRNEWKLVWLVFLLLFIVEGTSGQSDAAGAGGECAVLVEYRVQSAFGNRQYYVASIDIENADPEKTNISEWKIGFDLPDGDNVLSQFDVFERDVYLVQNGTSPVFMSSTGNNSDLTAIDYGSSFSFGFLLSKGSLNSTRPKPLKDLVFNNLVCTLDTSIGENADTQQNASSKDVVRLDYLPINYRNDSLAGTTEFYVILENVQNLTTIYLKDLTLYYYFHAIDNPPLSMLQNPNAYFNVICRSWEASNCYGMNLTIVPGYEDVESAQFAIKISFTDDAGSLKPKSARDIVWDTTSRDDLKFHLALAPRFGFFLNETMDYSYQSAPVIKINGAGESAIIPRQPVTNEKITVFLEDDLIWGVLPENNALSNSSLVDGKNPMYVCNDNDTDCRLMAAYCCTPADPSDPGVDSMIPDPWPPVIMISNGTGVDNGTIVTSPYIFDSTESSVAWVIGVAVGVSLAVIVAIGFAWFWRRRKRRKTNLLPQTKGDLDSHSSSPASRKHDAGDEELSWVVPIHRRLASDVSTYSNLSTPLQSSNASQPHSQVLSGLALHGYIDKTNGSSLGSINEQPKISTPVPVLIGRDHAGTTESSVIVSPYSPTEKIGSPFSYSGPGPLPDNLQQIVDRKCDTCPGLIGFSLYRSAGMKAAVHSDDESCMSSPVKDDSDSGFDNEYWQMGRRKSWDGVMTDASESDSHSAAQKVKKRRSNMNQMKIVLPPLAPLPPPLVPGLDPAPDVDLHVSWSEVERHIGKCLGTGGFGAVYEAIWKSKKVAVKKLPPFVSMDDVTGENNAEAAYQALIREIKLASKFQCERLVKVYGACTDDKAKCCLIMELMKGGNLSQRIHDRNRRRLSYIEILQLAHDIAEGLAYLHPSVIHRDLKPQNILLDEEGRAKIADFGISRVKDPAKSYLTQMTAENGTPMYMSPEQMNGGKVDEKVDVYALGCILNEAYTRRQPWKDSNHFFQIILKVAINGERPWMDPDCPEPLKRLIVKCWHQDPHQRPSCADIMRRTDILIQEELMKWEKFNPTLGQEMRKVVSSRA